MTNQIIKYVVVPPPHVHASPEIAEALCACAPALFDAAQRKAGRTRSLLQPFLSLEGRGGAIHTRALMRSFDDFVAGTDHPTAFQNNTPANFRRALTRELGCAEAPYSSPLDAHAEHRSANWQRLCDALERFDDLSPSAQFGWSKLLNRLGYYHLTVALLEEERLENRPSPKDRSAFISTLAIAKLKCGFGDQQAKLLSDASELCDTEFNEKAALEIYLTVHHGKKGGFSNALDHHSKRALEAFREQTETENGDDPLFESIFLRGLAFVPFNKRQFAEAEAMLDEAQRAAYRALADRRTDRLAAEENLFALLETRIKESLGKRSYDAALLRAEQLVSLDPDDPRTHLHLGEVYLAAGDLEQACSAFEVAVETGAPYTARSLFMLGATLAKTGRMNAAMAVQVAVLTLEPAAISALLELRRMASKDGRGALVRVIELQLSRLRAQIAERDVA